MLTPGQQAEPKRKATEARISLSTSSCCYSRIAAVISLKSLWPCFKFCCDVELCVVLWDWIQDFNPMSKKKLI